MAVKFLKENFGLSENLVREIFAFSTKEIVNNPKEALKNDAKELRTGQKIRAYQLIGWGVDLNRVSRLIEKAIQELDQRLAVSWSILNLIDLALKQSTIYASNQSVLPLLQKALGYEFKSQWTKLPVPLLRKQIIPKMEAILESKPL